MVCALAGSFGDEPMSNPDAGGNRVRPQQGDLSSLVRAAKTGAKTPVRGG
jgi:hypothetical protein